MAERTSAKADKRESPRPALITKVRLAMWAYAIRPRHRRDLAFEHQGSSELPGQRRYNSPPRWGATTISPGGGGVAKSALDLPKKYGRSRLRTWTTRATALAASRKYHSDFTLAVLQHQPDRAGGPKPAFVRVGRCRNALSGWKFRRRWRSLEPAQLLVS
jgi:hypothetical protein